MMVFYLGTNEPAWLGRVHIPLFVSYRRLARRKSLPCATCVWALDSSGFTRLQREGSWDGLPPREFVRFVRRCQDEIGKLEWSACQDWMCEPFMLERTGKSVSEHQALTVSNYLTLLDLAPDVPFVPTLQGWTLDDYLRCVELYDQSGIDLARASLVALGSVCRRQATRDAAAIVCALADLGLRLHAFGFKFRGLAQVADRLASADSMAWSTRSWREQYQEGGEILRGPRVMEYALDWRERMLAIL
jgi:hypothetical protein